MTRDNDTNIKVLTSNWGTTPILLDQPWLDPESLPTSIPDLEPILRKLPDETLYARVTGHEPGAGQPERIGLGESGKLEQALQEGYMHILGVNLNRVSDVFQTYLDNFVELISPVLERHGIKHPPEASIGAFLSSPNCVVPFHADQEHNFLMQVSGRKTMHIFPREDYSVFPAEYREILAQTRKCVLPYDVSFQEKALTMPLKPGSSTYQPPLAPHWVESTDSVNVSFAISIYTPAEERVRLIHSLNNRLRKFKMDPQQIGANPPKDKLKHGVAFSLQRSRQLLQGQGERQHF